MIPTFSTPENTLQRLESVCSSFCADEKSGQKIKTRNIKAIQKKISGRFFMVSLSLKAFISNWPLIRVYLRSDIALAGWGQSFA
jgi:hypothetical protein